MAFATLGSLLLLSLAACRPQPTTPSCVKVIGTVTVDNQPAEGVMISLHPTAGGASVSQAISGPDGEFVVSTYSKGDGAPRGEYKITCVWSRYDVISRDYVDDQLKGRFSEPAQSDIVWTLDPDQDAEPRRIELTTR